MPIGVRVHEFTGQAVGTYDGDGVLINDLCGVAAADAERFPLLSGVDPHDDTTFNARQAQRLGEELLALAEGDRPAEVREAAAELWVLVSLLTPARGRPHHRRLVFSGD